MFIDFKWRDLNIFSFGAVNGGAAFVVAAFAMKNELNCNLKSSATIDFLI